MSFILLFLSLVTSAQAANLEQLSREALGLVNQFQKLHIYYLKKPSPNISLKMVDAKELMFDDSVSTCETYPKVMVSVEKKYWMNSSFYEREKILFHTLGHCLLKRPHSSEMSFGVPVSIMGANLKNKDYVKYRELYWFELFTSDDILLRKALLKDNR